MTTSRRDFLKTAGVAAGAISLASLPSWITSVTAAEEAAKNGVDKNALADVALNTAKKLGVTYADIRIMRYRNESSGTREQQVQNVSCGQSFGFGVRVLYKGTWGFASSRSVTADEVKRITQQAVEIAKANSIYQRKRISLVPVEKIATTWKSTFDKDPFEVSIDDKIQFLLSLNDSAMKTKGVTFVNSFMGFVNEQKFYASTDGSRIEQYIEKHDWKREAQQAGEEAVMKLSAKVIEPGKYDLVLHPSHLWLTIHESVGHPTELDSSLWMAANYAGT